MEKHELLVKHVYCFEIGLDCKIGRIFSSEKSAKKVKKCRMLSNNESKQSDPFNHENKIQISFYL